jgi:hypothetical protein
MSRGYRHLQRTLLAVLDASDDHLDTSELTARAFALEPDAAGRILINPALVSAVRRALLSLVRAGLVARAIDHRNSQHDHRARWISARITLPTPNTTLHSGNHLLVWCETCRRQETADLQRLIEAGKGDVPLTKLRFWCTNCGSRLTDSVVTGGEAVVKRPGTQVSPNAASGKSP